MAVSESVLADMNAAKASGGTLFIDPSSMDDESLMSTLDTLWAIDATAGREAGEQIARIRRGESSGKIALGPEFLTRIPASFTAPQARALSQIAERGRKAVGLAFETVAKPALSAVGTVAGAVGRAFTPFESLQPAVEAAREAVGRGAAALGGAGPAAASTAPMAPPPPVVLSASQRIVAQRNEREAIRQKMRDVLAMQGVSEATQRRWLVNPTEDNLRSLRAAAGLPEVEVPVPAAEEVARTALRAPFEGAVTLAAEQVASPGGLATLPLLPAKAAIMGARSVAGIAAKGLGRIIGPGIRFVAREGMEVLAAKAPSLAGRLERMGAGFQTTGELRELRRGIQVDRIDFQDFARGLEDLPPLQKQQMFEAAQRTMEERFRIIEGLKGVAEDVPIQAVTPGEQATQAIRYRDVSGVGRAGGRPLPVELRDLFNRIPTVEAIMSAGAMKNTSLQEFADRFSRESQDFIRHLAAERGLAGTDPSVRALVHETWDRFERLAARQIAAEVGTPRAFALQRGTFLPDFYLQHEIPVSLSMRTAEVMRAGTGVLKREHLKARELQTLAEKRAGGILEEPGFAVAKGGAQEAFDANLGEYFQRIAAIPSLARSGAGRTPAWEVLSGRQYGSLNGMAVHPVAANEIKSLFAMRQGIEAGVEKWLQAWKSSRTIWNPPVHVGNIVSNMILVDLAGFDPILEFPTMRKAVESFIAGKRGKPDEVFEAIRKTGLIMSGLRSGTEQGADELSQMLTRMAQSFQSRQNGAEAALDAVTGVITEGSRWRQLTSKPGLAYGLEEEFSKYVLAYKGYVSGIPQFGVKAGDPLSAARHAEKWLFDYADVSLNTRQVRSGVLGAVGNPFITFSLKVAPRLVEGAAANPHKFVKYHAMLDGWNRAAIAELGLDPGQYKRWKDAQAEISGGGWRGDLERLLPFMILPVRDTTGTPYMIGLGRFTPWGQFFQPRGAGFPVGGGPLLSAVQAAAGRSFFGGRTFDPEAPAEMAGMALEVPVGFRATLAVVETLAPVTPLFGRLLRGALLAMGPEWTPSGPVNTPAGWLDWLGTQGGITHRGQKISTARQLIASFLVSPQAMDDAAAREFAGLAQKRRAAAFRGQKTREAIGFVRGAKVSSSPRPPLSP